jgi:hypothetical protein
MQTPLGRLWLLLLFIVAHPAQAGEITSVTPQADGSYRISAKATHKFTRNTRKLKDEAQAAAAAFCAKEGKQLKVLSVIEDKNQYLVGDFAQITLTFRALTGNDPELAPAAAPAAAAVAPPKPMTADELQAELTKLDDMRKKGLITDAEFEALKQKVLSRF